MVDIQRGEGDVSFSCAIDRVQFCLNQLEKYAFKKGVDFSTEITRNLTVEEVIGALVATEQFLIDVADLPPETDEPVVDFKEDKSLAKTKTWNIVSKESQRLLGRIAWCGAGYAFQAEPYAFLTDVQLMSIAFFARFETFKHNAKIRMVE